jgi:hypothetical protein
MQRGNPQRRLWFPQDAAPEHLPPAGIGFALEQEGEAWRREQTGKVS